MAATLSTSKVNALTSVRENGHYGAARPNTQAALENAKFIRVRKSLTGGFDKLVLTYAGNRALDAALAAQAPAAPVAPVNPLADKTPVELDTRASKLDGRYGQLLGLAAALADRLQYRAGQQPVKVTRSGRKTWTLATEVAAAELRRRLDAGEIASWDVDTAQDILKRLADIQAELIANRTEAGAIEAEYDRRPWTRFVGVAGGHVHSGIWCAGGTIRYDTTRTWAPELSGLSVDDAVAKLGFRLCTHCFPSAPVEWTQGVVKADDSCAGSGRSEVHGTYHRGSPGWGTCQGCGKTQTMTPRGLVRKHKSAK